MRLCGTLEISVASRNREAASRGVMVQHYPELG